MPTRRFFIKAAGIVTGALAYFPGSLAFAKKVAVALAKVEDLNKVNGWTILEIKGRNVLIIRESETAVRALDATCTHKKCKVAYLPDEKKLRCKCHKSFYDLDGNNTGGPAPKPLAKYPAELKDGRIIIDLPE